MNGMWLTLVLLLLVLQGCATNKVPIERDLPKAAVADTVTTTMVLAKGGRELNPVGFPAATALKAAYLFYFRDMLSEEQKKFPDRWVSTAWWAASANNLFQILVPHNVFVGATIGLATGIYIYNFEDPKQ
jgi:hypothetical protein